MTKSSLSRTWLVLATIALSACATPQTPIRPGFDRPALSPDNVITRVAFGSCAQQEKPQPIWPAVRAADPDLFLFMGDNVYGDVKSADLAELRAAYRAMADIDALNAFRKQVPVLAVWDDHDYGLNDAGADFPYRDQSKALFLEAWDVALDDPRRHRAGLYHQKIVGPAGQRLQIIMLDTRYFRSPLTRKPRAGSGTDAYKPDDDPTKTLLGAEQWRWLEAALNQPAEVRLIVSSIQVLAQGHRFEKWDNLPRERQRLFDLIKRTRATGVLLLSGDRHFSAFYKLDQATHYPLFEVTASSLNLPFRPKNPALPHRIGPVVGVANFGLIAIDWSAQRLTLDIRDADNRVVEKMAVNLKDLGVGAR